MRRGILSAVVVLIGVSLAFVLSPYALGRLTLVLAYGLAMIGLVLVSGFTGQLNLAQGAFFAVGAYTTTVLRATWHMPLLPALAMSGILAASLGILVALPAARLKHFYVALVTLSASVAVPTVLNRWESVTGGSAGLHVPRLSASSWLPLQSDAQLYLLALLLASLVTWFVSEIVASPLGKEMTAVRENEVAALSAGINPFVVKSSVITVSALLAGLGGGIFAQSIGFVSPETYVPLLSIMLLAGTIVGGVRSIPGAFLGALFVQFVPDAAGEINSSLAPVVFGIGLMAVIRFLPEGPISWAVDRMRTKVY